MYTRVKRLYGASTASQRVLFDQPATDNDVDVFAVPDGARDFFVAAFTDESNIDAGGPGDFFFRSGFEIVCIHVGFAVVVHIEAVVVITAGVVLSAASGCEVCAYIGNHGVRLVCSAVTLGCGTSACGLHELATPFNCGFVPNAVGKKPNCCLRFVGCGILADMADAGRVDSECGHGVLLSARVPGSAGVSISRRSCWQCCP